MGEVQRRERCPILRSVWSCLLVAGMSLFTVGPAGAATNDTHLKIKEIVRQLDYPETVAQDFLEMISRWKEEDGRESLLDWYDEILKVKLKYREGSMSAEECTRIEATVAEIMNERILKEIKISDKLDEYFLLQDVLRDREMLCLGYCQVFYVIATAVGLSARVVEVTGYAPLYSASQRPGHVACLVMFEDDRSLMVDYSFKSGPFGLQETFAKDGVFLRMKDPRNPMQMHTRIELLDEPGIRAHIQRNLARRYEKEGDLQTALIHYTRAITLNPQFASARVNRGDVYSDLGLLEKAFADYDSALSIDSENVAAYCSRGTLYDSMGDYHKAVADYNQAIALRPKMALLYSNRGSTYLKMGDRTRGIADLTSAIELDAGYIRAYFERGNVYFDMEQYEKAIQEYSIVLQLDPNYGKAFVNRGLCFTRTGNKAKAAQDLRKALDLDPSLSEWVMQKARQYGLDL